jgi:hypothetical protein
MPNETLSIVERLRALSSKLRSTLGLASPADAKTTDEAAAHIEALVEQLEAARNYVAYHVPQNNEGKAAERLKAIDAVLASVRNA